MEKLKSQARPQNYQHNYLLVLLTGLLGCKWHRYKQSKEANGKWNLIAAGLVVASFLYTCFIFYIWMVLDNDFYTIATTRTLEWDISFYLLGLVLICFLFSYHAIIFILCLLHIQHGFQLYVHPLHLFISFLSILGCTTVIILLCTFHFSWWALMCLSLKVTGPFLYLCILIVMTVVCFILIRQWLLTSWRWGKWAALAGVAVIMLCLYFVPLGIDSPLVAGSTPPRPGVIAMGGSANEAPVNSKVAFEKSIQENVAGVYVTVQFSSDGVPFIFSESSLDPWTDAASKFPGEDRGLNPMAFTIAELQNLTNGCWFLHHDPFNTASDLTKEEVKSIKSTPILTLREFLSLIATSSQSPTTVLVTEASLPKFHLMSLKEKYTVVNATLRDPLWNSTSIFWKSAGDKYFRLFSDVSIPSEDQLLAVYLDYTDADRDMIRYYHNKNITVVVGVINTDWLMSYFHFLSVDFVATYEVSHMVAYRDPVWRLSSSQYHGMWISMDIVSMVCLAVIYIFLRIRLFGTRFSPESISLNTGRAGKQYRSRNMKEKLLREGAGMDVLEDTEMQAGRENNPMTATYAITSCSGSILGQDSSNPSAPGFGVASTAVNT